MFRDVCTMVYLLLVVAANAMMHLGSRKIPDQAWRCGDASVGVVELRCTYVALLHASCGIRSMSLLRAILVGCWCAVGVWLWHRMCCEKACSYAIHTYHIGDYRWDTPQPRETPCLAKVPVPSQPYSAKDTAQGLPQAAASVAKPPALPTHSACFRWLGASPLRTHTRLCACRL